MTQLSNLKQDLETLSNSNVDFLKFNENGETHEKVDKQAVLDKIKRQNQMVSIVESLKEYTWEEKVEWMHQKKLKGNRLFNKKKYDEAIQTYLEALTGMDLNCAPEKKQRILTEVQIPCLLNIASCMKQKKEFNKGLDLCTKAIALNKENPTAYMRRGMIYQAMKEHDKAINDYKTARNLGAEDTALSAISNAIQEIRGAQAKAKKAYKGSLEEGGSSKDTTISTNDESQEQSKEDKKSGQDEENVKILYYNDDLEELSHYGVLKYVAYPIKKSLGYIKERTYCCRRRRTSYEPLETDDSFHP